MASRRSRVNFDARGVTPLTATGSRTVLGLAAVTVLVPLLCVYLAGPLFWRLTQRPERALEDAGTAFVQACLTGAAFFALTLVAAAKRIRGTLDAGVARALRVAAAAGIVVTLLLWGLYYWDGYVYWRDAGTGGANIGLGVLMLVLPVLAGLPMAVAYAASLRSVSRP